MTAVSHEADDPNDGSFQTGKVESPPDVNAPLGTCKMTSNDLPTTSMIQLPPAHQQLSADRASLYEPSCRFETKTCAIPSNLAEVALT